MSLNRGSDDVKLQIENLRNILEAEVDGSVLRDKLHLINILTNLEKINWRDYDDRKNVSDELELIFNGIKNQYPRDFLIQSVLNKRFDGIIEKINEDYSVENQVTMTNEFKPTEDHLSSSEQNDARQEATQAVPTKNSIVDPFAVIKSCEIKHLEEGSKHKYSNEYASNIEKLSRQLTTYVQIELSKIGDLSHSQKIEQLNPELPLLIKSVQDFVCNDMMRAVETDNIEEVNLAVARWINIAVECTRKGDLFTGDIIYTSLASAYPLTKIFAIQSAKELHKESLEYLNACYSPLEGVKLDGMNRVKCYSEPPAIAPSAIYENKMTTAKEADNYDVVNRLRMELRVNCIQAKTQASLLSDSEYLSFAKYVESAQENPSFKKYSDVDLDARTKEGKPTAEVLEINETVEKINHKYAAPVGFELASMSDRDRDTNKIYLEVTEEAVIESSSKKAKTVQGLRVAVKNSEGKIKKAIIPWEQLPRDFPHDVKVIMASPDKYLAIIIDCTSKAGLTHSINDNADEVQRLCVRHEIEELDSNVQEYLNSKSISALASDIQLNFDAVVEALCNPSDENKLSDEHKMALMKLKASTKAEKSVEKKIELLAQAKNRPPLNDGSALSIEKFPALNKRNKISTKANKTTDLLGDFIKLFQNASDAEKINSECQTKGSVVHGMLMMQEIDHINSALKNVSAYVNLKVEMGNINSTISGLTNGNTILKLDEYRNNEKKIQEMIEQIKIANPEKFASYQKLKNGISDLEREIENLKSRQEGASKKMQELEGQLGDQKGGFDAFLRNNPNFSAIEDVDKNNRELRNQDANLKKLYDNENALKVASEKINQLTITLAGIGLNAEKLNDDKLNLKDVNGKIKQFQEVLLKISTTLESPNIMIGKLAELENDPNLAVLKDIKIDGKNIFEHTRFKILELEVEKKRMAESVCLTSMKSCVRNKERMSLEEYVTSKKGKVDKINKNKVTELGKIMSDLDNPTIPYKDKMDRIDAVLRSGVLNKRKPTKKNIIKMAKGKKTVATNRLVAYKASLREAGLSDNHNVIVDSAFISLNQFNRAEEVLRVEKEKFRVGGSRESVQILQTTPEAKPETSRVQMVPKPETPRVQVVQKPEISHVQVVPKPLPKLPPVTRSSITYSELQKGDGLYLLKQERNKDEFMLMRNDQLSGIKDARLGTLKVNSDGGIEFDGNKFQTFDQFKAHLVKNRGFHEENFLRTTPNMTPQQIYPEVQSRQVVSGPMSEVISQNQMPQSDNQGQSSIYTPSTSKNLDKGEHTQLLLYLNGLQLRRLKHHHILDVDHFNNYELSQYKSGMIDSQVVATNKSNSQYQFAAFLVARNAEMHRSKLTDEQVLLLNQSLDASIEWAKPLKPFMTSEDGREYYKKDEKVPCEYHHASLLLYAKNKLHQGKDSLDAATMMQLRRDAAEKLIILLSLKQGSSFTTVNAKPNIEATQKEACDFLRHHPKFVHEQGLSEILEATERRLGINPGLLDKARQFYEEEIKPKGK